MSRKKSAEQKLVEAIRELGLEKASSIFKVLAEYSQPKVYTKHKFTAEQLQNANKPGAVIEVGK